MELLALIVIVAIFVMYARTKQAQEWRERDEAAIQARLDKQDMNSAQAKYDENERIKTLDTRIESFRRN